MVLREEQVYRRSVVSVAGYIADRRSFAHLLVPTPAPWRSLEREAAQLAALRAVRATTAAERDRCANELREKEVVLRAAEANLATQQKRLQVGASYKKRDDGSQTPLCVELAVPGMRWMGPTCVVGRT